MALNLLIYWFSKEKQDVDHLKEIDHVKSFQNAASQKAIVTSGQSWLSIYNSFPFFVVW